MKMERLFHPTSNHQFHFLLTVVVIYFCCVSEIPSVNAWKHQHGMGFVHHGFDTRTMKTRKRKMKHLTNSENDDDDKFKEPYQPPQGPTFFGLEEDPDGVPLFDQRVTFLGLEPKAELDLLDNGLAFTGPIILFFSVYLTLSLFFAGESEVPAIFEDLAGNQIS
mmetsp:Transcript_13070/g.24526  ORF Transcript_13070/g.24526 Transcript_13070/m.24526 type:complete len:164 (-) Transcript_13070:1828-2319(-)